MDPPFHSRKQRTVQTLVFQEQRLWQLCFEIHGIIFVDYSKKRKTINGEYYVRLLQQLSDEITEKQHHFVKEESAFHQNNAKYAIIMTKIHEFAFERVSYSPNLAGSQQF